MSKSGFRSQGQGKRKRKLIDSGTNNNDLNKRSRSIFPGKGDVIADVVPPVFPLKFIVFHKE
jgi:hypothetical protein